MEPRYLGCYEKGRGFQTGSYIRGVTLNGETFNKTFLSHDEILAGGEIVFKMTSAPDKKWGTALESRPPSGMSGLNGGK